MHYVPQTWREVPLCAPHGHLLSCLKVSETEFRGVKSSNNPTRVPSRCPVLHASKAQVSLTCDQVGEGPHGALQLRGGARVPPHVLGVTLIEASRFRDVRFNVGHV